MTFSKTERGSQSICVHTKGIFRPIYVFGQCWCMNRGGVEDTKKNPRPRTDPLKAKYTRRKCSPKKRKKIPKKVFQAISKQKGVRARRRRFSAKNQAFSKKQKKGLREVSADFQGKVKRRSWPWPIFNESKKVLSSRRGQDIFEDL